MLNREPCSLDTLSWRPFVKENRNGFVVFYSTINCFTCWVFFEKINSLLESPKEIQSGFNPRLILRTSSSLDFEEDVSKGSIYGLLTGWLFFLISPRQCVNHLDELYVDWMCAMSGNFHRDRVAVKRGKESNVRTLKNPSKFCYTGKMEKSNLSLIVTLTCPDDLSTEHRK